MKKLLGIEGHNSSPEETYVEWFSNIEPEAVSSVLASVEKMSKDVLMKIHIFGYTQQRVNVLYDVEELRKKSKVALFFEDIIMMLMMWLEKIRLKLICYARHLIQKMNIILH